MITSLPRLPDLPEHAFGVDDNDVLSLTLNPVPNAVPHGGSLQPNSSGSLVPSADTLEAIALEGYRSGALTESQVRRVLGFETRLEVNSFLKDRGVYYNYSPSELDQEIETNERLLEAREREVRSR